MFEIHLKESANTEKLNQILDSMKSENEFITPKMNQEWLDDINTNPKSYQRHLKPEDRDLTMEELKESFSFFTEEHVLKCDTKFDRTSSEEMQRLAQFVYDYKGDIDFVKNSDTLMEKSDIPTEHQQVLNDLEKPYIPPEKLPEDEQWKPDMTSGVLLCKSWGIEPFWVMFGSVDSPRFAKEKIYKDNVYNNLYRDNKNRGYMLLPLYDFSEGFIQKVINEAWEIGLRENPTYFAHMVYNFETNATEKELGEEFKEFYTVDERIERLKASLSKIKSEVKVLHVTLKNTTRNRIVADKDKSNLKGKLKVINALLYSLKDDYDRLGFINFDKYTKDSKMSLEFYNGDVITV